MSKRSAANVDKGVPTPDNGPGAVERWQEKLREVPAPQAVRATLRQPSLERPRTVLEAAEELGLSVHTVRAWVADRRLAHLRLGRAIRIPAAEIRRVLNESTIPAARKR